MKALLNLNHRELTEFIHRKYGKSASYGDAVFRRIYGSSKGAVNFRDNPVFDQFCRKLLSGGLPDICSSLEEEGTIKFLLDWGKDGASESVIIPMKDTSTLCVSSQIGCRYACSFCATGQMGLVRDLECSEILAQVLKAREIRPDIRNLVFMGMGEPLDNFHNLVKSLEILSDERGLAIPKRRISISTAGHTEGIRRLNQLASENPDDHYHTLHLSLSLHSAREETRTALMPINSVYPLPLLKEALMESPWSRLKDGLYIEYLIIPGVTNSRKEIDALFHFLEGMEAKINLIPYNPVIGSPWSAPSEEEINRLWTELKNAGYYCRTRKSKGENLMAACGQLGAKEMDNEQPGEQL